ncbi:MAG: type VI secretion system ATPase TssH [Acidobacteria bacterium]|nr:type VI secretion system ATPase TssH [Acidobacteriota bacterium]
MIEVDAKLLLNRLNHFCKRSLEAAAGQCVSRAHYEVGIEHFLLQLLDDPKSDICMALAYFEIDPARVRKALQRILEGFRSGNPGKPVFSPQVLDWLQDAWLIGSVDLGLSLIRSGALLVALVNNLPRYLGGGGLDLLEKIQIDALKREFFEITAGSPEEIKTAAAEPGSPSAKEGEADSALAKFTLDFTERARQGEIDPVFGRDREIRQMIDILARRRKNNPIVVGEAGVGKTAVVEGLALKIVQDDVPAILKDVRLLSLDLGLLQAGAGVRGEFENRLKAVITEVKASASPIILFIDEAHTLIGAGGTAGGGDAANLLKPALARGELRTVAATTWSEYKKYFEKDAALARRFQPVALEEPSEEDATVILRGLREKYEESHQVHILDDAIVAAARLSSRYISGRQLPDKAVDLLDTAAARVKIGLSSRPDILEDRLERVRILERELGALDRDAQAGVKIDNTRLKQLKKEIADEKKAFEGLEKRWKKENKAAANLVKLRNQGMDAKSDADSAQIKKQLKQAEKQLAEAQDGEPLISLEVNPDVIAKVVADWTGIPVGNMVKDEANLILKLDKQLGERIKGQDHALEMLARGIRASKAGISNPNTPIGVFLFVGPSGVGKTETALSLAETLFGGERFMTTINMSEFQEKHTVSRLIGSPPGYVGFGEGGVLTEAVRQRPYSVVLLDEVEKADPEVMNLFYQTFDKGMLSDGEGRVIDFKNTVIIMTSNLASDIITSIPQDQPRPAVSDLTAAIRPVLSNHFKPALLARMTIVPFYSIDVESMKGIVRLKLGHLGRRLKDNHQIILAYPDSVVDQIAERCTEVETGARNIDHIMQGNLLPLVSSEILQKMAEGKLPEKLEIQINESGDFELRFS